MVDKTKLIEFLDDFVDRHSPDDDGVSVVDLEAYAEEFGIPDPTFLLGGVSTALSSNRLYSGAAAEVIAKQLRGEDVTHEELLGALTACMLSMHSSDGASGIEAAPLRADDVIGYSVDVGKLIDRSNDISNYPEKLAAHLVPARRVRDQGPEFISSLTHAQQLSLLCALAYTALVPSSAAERTEYLLGYCTLLMACNPDLDRLLDIAASDCEQDPQERFDEGVAKLLEEVQDSEAKSFLEFLKKHGN